MRSAIPNNYDPATLLDWLRWKNHCHEASGAEFQRLFETIASRLYHGFIPIKPHGKLGDRKSDGFYWKEGTLFQVYSPDKLGERKTLDKIREDLAGAVAEWKDDIKKWVFVFNTRRGVHPDVPAMLFEVSKKYPQLETESLSSHDLWELIREKLTPQQRAEVLGPPPGDGHMSLPSNAESGDAAKLLDDDYFLVIHDVLSPINIQDAVKALDQGRPFGPPYHIRPLYPDVPWEAAADYQAAALGDLLQKGRHLLPRFAVFSLAPIPLAIHLGYVFSDRVEVFPFQYDRDRKSWIWDASRSPVDQQFRVEGLPTTRIDGSEEVIIRVSLSALIDPKDAIAVAGDIAVQIDLSVDDPDVTWLHHPSQLSALGGEFRRLLKVVNRFVPRCRLIHLFYAGPTGGAIVLGQAINPRMNPPVALYQYERRHDPRYERVLTLQ